MISMILVSSIEVEANVLQRLSEAWFPPRQSPHNKKWCSRQIVESTLLGLAAPVKLTDGQ